MSQTIALENFSSLNLLEQTELNADVAVGATTISPKSTDNLTANHLLYLGRTGSEGGEKVTIDAIASETSLTIDAPGTTKPHSQFEPVYRLFGDQLKVYRALNVDGSTPADGSFSLLGTPLDIDFDDVQTSYTDPDGSEDYWYKYTFYNSVSTEETDIAATNAVRGGNVGNYASITAVRREAGLLTNRNISDAMIDEQRQTAQALINARLGGRYIVPFSGSINPLVEKMTVMLAAGWLLLRNYGPNVTLNTNDGNARVNWVTNNEGTGILDKLDKGEMKLTGADGVVTGSNSTQGEVTSWPNDSTDTAASNVGGGERMFRVSDRQGYGTRLY